MQSYRPIYYAPPHYAIFITDITYTFVMNCTICGNFCFKRCIFSKLRVRKCYIFTHIFVFMVNIILSKISQFYLVSFPFSSKIFNISCNTDLLSTLVFNYLKMLLCCLHSLRLFSIPTWKYFSFRNTLWYYSVVLGPPLLLIRVR